MKLDDFDYNLPEELIAQTPLANRADSKLLVIDRQTGLYEDKNFGDIFSYLRAGDTLVLNDTRVIPARLIGQTADTKSKIEIFLLKPLNDTDWEVLVKPGKKARLGRELVFGEERGSKYLLTAEIIEHTDAGGRVVRFSFTGIFNEILDQLGTMPLPPYIQAKLDDQERYQTVYAKHRGSVAAPTAGLHFQEDTMDELQTRGVNLAFVTLHVGLGTFRPVQAEDIRDHQMHAEYYELSRETAKIINRTKNNNGRVISVGTTSTRVIESLAVDGILAEDDASGWTDIFIYPGYDFKIIDGLLTNFHLPKSSLIMLVSALAGRENILAAYEHAVAKQYRFFSFGDAMLIL